MDAAFATAAYPSCTDADLLKAVRNGHANSVAMKAELFRRLKVVQGDVSVMTPGERLRFVRTGKAR